MLATTPQISIEWFVQSCHCNEYYIYIWLSLKIIYVTVYDRNVCHHLGKDDHVQPSTSSHPRCPTPPIYATSLSSRSCLHISNHPNFLSLELGIWWHECIATRRDRHHMRPGSTHPHDDWGTPQPGVPPAQNLNHNTEMECGSSPQHHGVVGKKIV